MPHSQEAKDEWREFEKLALTDVCTVCGSGLRVPYDHTKGKVVLVCSKDKTHIGHTKQDPAMKRFEAMRKQIAERGESTEVIDREIQTYLNQKHSRKGKHMTTGGTALQQYQEKGLISEEQAMEIIRTTPGWGRAPDNVIKKAALICRDYKLYPGIHVFLICFGKGTDKESWAPVFGINSNRLLASRKKAYKYIDGPRVASEEEAKKHFLNEYDSNLIYGYCKVEGLDGSIADGWGTWKRSDKVQGEDKGNSKANMVEIRAERRALNRLCPGELPSGFDVIDEEYINGTPETAQREVNQETGEIIEAQVVEVNGTAQQPKSNGSPQAQKAEEPTPAPAGTNKPRGMSSPSPDSASPQKLTTGQKKAQIWGHLYAIGLKGNPSAVQTWARTEVYGFIDMEKCAPAEIEKLHNKAVLESQGKGEKKQEAESLFP